MGFTAWLPTVTQCWGQLGQEVPMAKGTVSPPICTPVGFACFGVWRELRGGDHHSLTLVCHVNTVPSRGNAGTRPSRWAPRSSRITLGSFHLSARCQPGARSRFHPARREQLSVRSPPSICAAHTARLPEFGWESITTSNLTARSSIPAPLHPSPELGRSARLSP